MKNCRDEAVLVSILLPFFICVMNEREESQVQPNYDDQVIFKSDANYESRMRYEK